MSLFLAILASFFLNILIYFNFNFLSKKINIFDKPDSFRKFHSRPIANIGGILIFINLIYLYLLFLIDVSFFEENIYFQKKNQFNSFFLTAIPLIVLGSLDDKYKFSANTKTFFISIVILFVLYFDKELQISQLRFSFIEYHIALNNFTIFFSLVSIFLFMNSLNMMDGINLLAGLYCLILLIILILFSNFTLPILFIVVGLLNFLILNYQNRIFLGDSGSIILSYIISYIVIKSYNIESVFFADQIFLIMMIPGLDLVRVAISRMLRGKNPLSGDRDHLHYLLSDKYNPSIAVLFILSLILIPILINFQIGHTVSIIFSSFLIYVITILYLKIS